MAQNGFAMFFIHTYKYSKNHGHMDEEDYFKIVDTACWGRKERRFEVFCF